MGGRWEDCCTRRAGYGRTGMFNLLPRKKGNFYGVSTLMFFNNCDHVSVVGATLERTESPARRYSIRGVIEKIDRPE